MQNNLIPAAGASKLEKPRPIPAKVKAAIELIVAGKVRTITDAAATVGLSREHLSRELSKPHVADFLREKAGRNVLLATGRASARYVELIDAKSEHVAAEVSKNVLAIGGIKPASDPNVNLNVNIHAGYVIDLSEGSAELPSGSPLAETKSAA